MYKLHPPSHICLFFLFSLESYAWLLSYATLTFLRPKPTGQQRLSQQILLLAAKKSAPEGSFSQNHAPATNNLEIH